MAWSDHTGAVVVVGVYAQIEYNSNQLAGLIAKMVLRKVGSIFPFVSLNVLLYWYMIKAHKIAAMLPSAIK